jgi:tetratricopeptide (TPR) repeat protein
MVRKFSRRLVLPIILLNIAAVLQAQEKVDALNEYRLGNFENAIAICLAELETSPTNMDSYAVLCWSLIKLGRYEEVAARATAARQLNRYDPRLAEALAEARYYQGRNVEALRLFQEYADLAPEGGRIDSAYYFMGELFIRMGRFRHADIALTTAVRYVPGDAVWWTRLGYARENAKELSYAVIAYERALTLNPQSSDAKRGLERSRRAIPVR